MDPHWPGTRLPSGDSARVIEELVTSGMIAAGGILFFFACAIAWTKGSWRKTHAVVYAAGEETNLRWHDARFEICEVTLSERESRSVDAGSEVAVHYQVRAPENWSFTSPHRRTRIAAAVGFVLAAAGTAASLADAIGIMQ